MNRLPASLLICVTALMISYNQFASADEPDEELGELRSEIEALKTGQEAIRQQLREIQNLLANRQLPITTVSDVDVTLDVAQAPAKGAANARVTLIEYSDYQCPFCARHTLAVLPQLEKEYVSTGRIRYVLRDYPMRSIHPQAPKVHEAALCAGDQDKYWEMHGQLFANQANQQAEQLQMFAQRIRLADLDAFEQCLASSKYAESIIASIVEGTEAGVRGTPSFLLGIANTDGTVRAVKLIQGAQTYAVFQQVIEELLTATES